ncbi:uncharacterized protein LOC100908443 isoform X2 [Galendromus occidentalis]|uniref:Uncharacterized protein LOC100908443 isoform X2 n=1 Tax=Galendromus occidentalis TaxID=34638 RepID=A0AAJ6VWQ4_9ACAR|nr:uncharacterized protein LOC100908443 isoform X2 [Galendromus occidentalis]
MTSILGPKSESAGALSLALSEITNSSTVQLSIARNNTSDSLTVVEYHIAVCSKPVPLWGNAVLASLFSPDRRCESIVTTNSSVDLLREPWTDYEISVIACYGAFDSDDPVNVSLPILKKDPEPLSGLAWVEAQRLLVWEYESPLSSGFSISICPARNDPTVLCSNIEAGPLDRQYHIDSSLGTEGGFVVVAYPFISYEGSTYRGSKSEISVNLPDASGNQ